MTASARIICRPALIPGFALAGVTAQAVGADEEPESVIAGLRSRDVGVVLLEEAIYDTLTDETRARLDRSVRPVVVPFPGPTWIEAASAEARVVDLLRRAIGYRVRLR